jgi:hypothetical protein
VGGGGRRQEEGATKLHPSFAAANPYEDVHHEQIVMPKREHKPDYTRHPVLDELYVPAVY